MTGVLHFGHPRAMWPKLIVALTVAGLAGFGCRPKITSQGSRASQSTPATDLDPRTLARFALEDSVQGELVYVPVHSRVFQQAGRSDLLLTTTLSVHNLRLDAPITLSSVVYCDTEGRPLREYVPEPTEVAPLATRHFLIPRRDDSGGTGASLLVRWESPVEATKPIIEAVMISTSGQQGISFGTPGELVSELTHGPAAASAEEN